MVLPAFQTGGRFGFQQPDVPQPINMSDYLGRSGAVEQANPMAGFTVNPVGSRFSADTSGGGATGAEGARFTGDFGFGQQNQDTAGASFGFGQQTGGALSKAGGAWAALDAHNNEIGASANKYGVPANLLKSMINRESSGQWDKNNYVNSSFRGDEMLPFVGIFRNTANAWGLNFDQMVGNKQAQIDGMAKIMAGLASQYGGYENAAKVYFGGEKALNGGFTDELGMNSNTYGQKAIDGWKYLDGLTGGGALSQAGQGASAGLGSGDANKVVDIARGYVGVPYVWGSLPGVGADPWKTGWDCSGFMDWLDNNYGSNELPAGSHYQYQDSVNKGLLFTDWNQMKPGDLMFFDTGWQGGAGAEQNRAGHVGMYIGNGQFIQAANPGAGTIISNVNGYAGQFIGARHMSWSGGGAAGAGLGGVSSAQPSFNSMVSKYLLKAA